MTKGELLLITVGGGILATVIGGLILAAVLPAVLPTIGAWYGRPGYGQQ